MREADVMMFIEPLQRAGFEYMVTGSIAGIIYGEPRLTHDVDLVLAIPAGRAGEFAALYPPDRFYCPPVEVIRIEIGRDVRGFFNLISHQTGYKADIYPTGTDPLHRWAFGRRRQMTMEQSALWVAPPEYVIVRKLEYYREGGSGKHLEDIRKMLAVSGGQIDREWLEAKLMELDLKHYLDKMNL